MKIKSENDLLRFLIDNADANNDIRADVVLKNSGLDPASVNKMLNDLSDKVYVIVTTDTITLTALGRNNYISFWDKVLAKFISLASALICFAAGTVFGAVGAVVEPLLVAFIKSFF